MAGNVARRIGFANEERREVFSCVDQDFDGDAEHAFLLMLQVRAEVVDGSSYGVRRTHTEDEEVGGESCPLWLVPGRRRV